MVDSVEFSRGIPFRDLYNHPNVRQMTVEDDGSVAENIHVDQFHLSPVNVDGALAFHATLV